MHPALALTLLALVHADAVHGAATSESSALVVVALPANANRAITEALHRLRGEATSVGFEVRFVNAESESVTTDRLQSISRALHPAAVVAFAGALAETAAAQTLDVWFMDRASGKISVVHLSADGVDGEKDRSDVVLAVRAVDFIRARMFDTLVEQKSETERPVGATVGAVRERRLYLALGVDIVGQASGFAPAVAAAGELAYGWTRWLRTGIAGFGFGTRPQLTDGNGVTSVDFEALVLQATWLAPPWGRLRAALDTGVGEYWVVVRGRPPAVLGAVEQTQTQTKSSPGLHTGLRLSVQLTPHWFAELHGGTHWLQSQVKVGSSSDTHLSTFGRPLLVGSARLGAAF